MGIHQKFVELAEKLTPDLHESIVLPKSVIEVVADEEAFQGWRTQETGSISELESKSFGKDESFILDFGDHQVGYISLSIKSVGSPQDAPLGLKLIFGEMPCEVAEPFDSYDGWLSKSWLQEETIYMDVLPTVLKLPRRYCFRYVKMMIIDTSRKFTVSFSDIHCTAVTSADLRELTPLPANIPADLQAIDAISIKTLQDCMQTVFEDGPKRDRRLWIGDLRLQALANYQTFHHHDLVKRCLYLFGGMTLDDGAVGACVFEKPNPLVDDTRLYDYSLFFVATLFDYYEASKDREALVELWPVALEQIQIGLERLDEYGLVRDDETWWCFTDWHPELNKQASAQSILLYCLKRGLGLAKELEKDQEATFISEQIDRVTSSALQHLWDEKTGFFVSGVTKQVSWASQVWIALAGVLNEEENGQLMDRLFESPPEIGMTTPYMYHHLIEALFESGRSEKALEQIRAYWGEMVKDGADCFWEIYNPNDKKLSPYGSNLINSYCHAWSCTPTYFIRKYLL
ncbi:alpha-L-rhamnosidase-related protein [Paenibacillus sp. Soil750]|uniref:alpha-L-rhamnosidase-related protein n=1 Tax=Paenibacillus sp. Soil750 TaxID=1736398 RepID=UPI00070213B3|nr:family 78 glycoside hydrolase catalytic domain [Paenibacillus sp. Soil750]KRE64654.1 sugar hydrolase [Paenibacillus sp. Soil750]